MTLVGRCCLCDSETVNLKCFDKLTGELLWNRLESNPFLDEVGDVWTEVTVSKWARSLAYNITESMTSSVTVAGYEDAPSYKPAWNEPAGWQPSVDTIIRKINGATGAVIAVAWYGYCAGVLWLARSGNCSGFA